jgi:hypothetical protein
MRCLPLFWGVFAGGKGQGGRRTQRIFWVFPGRGGAASTEIASWELAAVAIGDPKGRIFSTWRAPGRFQLIDSVRRSNCLPLQYLRLIYY